MQVRPALHVTGESSIGRIPVQLRKDVVHSIFIGSMIVDLAMQPYSESSVASSADIVVRGRRAFIVDGKQVLRVLGEGIAERATGSACNTGPGTAATG
ncbi:MAG: hypothetical protein HYR55_09150 [Acidobacteria bacterium]|nr:hypothetical protein [Acidobacteriota bacterium]MBI3658179.1 hypothetical protein [Acidobacteriota bacterium]